MADLYVQPFLQAVRYYITLLSARKFLFLIIFLDFLPINRYNISMEFLTVSQMAKKWNVSERTVRNYCANNKISDAKISGKTWLIPEDAKKPERSKKKMFSLLAILKEERDMGLKGGIYHKTQVEFSYNTNHIEGSTLSEEQTRFIFETNTIGVSSSPINADDVIETTNHFKCFDYMIDNANKTLSEKFIKKLHYILKSSTSDSKKKWFNIGEYKSRPNEIGGNATCPPSEVAREVQNLLQKYNSISKVKIEDIIEFHKNFETIHPFQDGNGRVGRLIMFKECLKNNIIPFIINDEIKWFYYRGLREWDNEKGFLIETCLAAQDRYKQFLKYFEII